MEESDLEPFDISGIGSGAEQSVADEWTGDGYNDTAKSPAWRPTPPLHAIALDRRGANWLSLHVR